MRMHVEGRVPVSPHRCLELVGAAGQDAVAGRNGTPLHRVGTQLRVDHLQVARLGPPSHGLLLYISSL